MKIDELNTNNSTENYLEKNNIFLVEYSTENIQNILKITRLF